MGEINDGGPAFARPYSEATAKRDEWSDQQDGMTLRDYFAAAALTGLLANKQFTDFADKIGDGETPEQFRERATLYAYGTADAMLAERQKGRG